MSRLWPPQWAMAALFFFTAPWLGNRRHCGLTLPGIANLRFPGQVAGDRRAVGHEMLLALVQPPAVARGNQEHGEATLTETLPRSLPDRISSPTTMQR